jgi:hypothetical protein
VIIHHGEQTCDGSDIAPDTQAVLAEDDGVLSLWFLDDTHCAHGTPDELKALVDDRGT